MLDSIKKAAGLVTPSGRPIPQIETKVYKDLHPLNDPAVWAETPMYDPPGDINIEAEQKWIDDLMGVTRDSQSIYKLVWSGDRSYWYEFFTEWNALGHPTAPLKYFPKIRCRGKNKAGELVMMFPPRWILYSRLEPEQYADGWKRESWIYAPEIKAPKLIRPEEPPPVFWLWYTTIGEHNDYCCSLNSNCYGSYAPPKAIRPTLEMQKAADASAGQRGVFEKIDYGFATEIEEKQSGYRQMLKKIEIESQVYAENPMALLGVEATLRAGITPKDADRIVKNYYDREKAATAKLI